ncbi:HlyD family secretion protein [Cupriavidus gilardii]|uniref:HlyD family secretion protein n=1 Tax=Cupriavidus gilardii TaxID=82541 RepID=UPI0021BE2D0B|nr:HlyD family secretion protein [Cupriavidus gilardii]MCT9124512.1 HlyD family secretion protein [Cupriavidus gilardii]
MATQARSPASSRGPSRRALLVSLTIAGALLAGYGGYRWWQHRQHTVTSDNAYVRADVTAVAPRVAGYVRAVAVDDNQRVRAGDVLFRIDDADYQARVSQAEADVRARRAALATLERQHRLQQAQIRQAQATLRIRQSATHRAALDHRRHASLLEVHASSRQTYELARAEAEQAAAAEQGALAQLDAERRRLDVIAAQVDEARAAEAAALARLELARIDLGNTVVRAPVDGVVGNRQIRVGRYVQPGTQALALVPVETSWVVANLKETELHRIRVGSPVRIELDGYPGVPIDGTVVSVSPGSGAQFALLPPDNATGNFTKIVQHVPVKIMPTRGGPLHGKLVPGLSAVVSIDTRPGAAASATPAARQVARQLPRGLAQGPTQGLTQGLTQAR